MIEIKKCEYIMEYITIKLIEEKPKTKVYGVFNTKNGILLGTIKWYCSWRQYCFFPNYIPDSLIVFSTGCMNDIIKYIEALNKKQKELKNT